LYVCHHVLFSDGAVHISGDSLNTEWTMKSVKQWVSDDVLCWIISVAHDRELNTEDIDMSHFREIDGTTLYRMTEEDFMSMESQYGKLLYCILQRLKQEQDQRMAYDLNKCEFFFFFFFSILHVKVVCMLHVQYKMG